MSVVGATDVPELGTLKGAVIVPGVIRLSIVARWVTGNSLSFVASVGSSTL